MQGNFCYNLTNLKDKYVSQQTLKHHINIINFKSRKLYQAHCICIRTSIHPRHLAWHDEPERRDCSIHNGRKEIVSLSPLTIYSRLQYSILNNIGTLEVGSSRAISNNFVFNFI